MKECIICSKECKDDVCLLCNEWMEKNIDYNLNLECNIDSDWFSHFYDS